MATTTVLGVSFAPINIPWRRRLQTLAVLLHIFTFLIWPVVSVVATLLLLRSRFFWLPLLYAGWFFYDRHTPRQGSRLHMWFRRLPVWRYFRDYFPVRLVKTAELPPDRNYILGYHPHGIISIGAFTNFGTDATDFTTLFPGIISYPCTLVGQFWFPLRREYIMMFGAIEVSKESLQHLFTQMGRGNAAVIVVGGAAEALDANPGHFDLVLNRRKGFVKTALKYGADLVPVYSFGENDLFIQASNPQGSWIRAMQVRLKNFLGFSPPLFHGRGIFNYDFGLLPFRRPIVTVVGKPIRVEKVADPTRGQVELLHQAYKAALIQLFEDNKEHYGVAPEVHLTIHD